MCTYFLKDVQEIISPRSRKRESVTDYIELLEQHISKENTMLFSMADKLLSAEMQEKLFDRFETLKEEVIGMGKHEELHKRLERLGTTYLGRSGHGQH